MKEKEKQLFKTMCKFKDRFDDINLIKFATPSVLGHLFINRMQGIAYGTLKQNGLLGSLNREFRNSLHHAYEENILKNKSFLSCVGNLANLLSSCDRNVAMLKGAYLCAQYPEGYRTSNDVDLLVLPGDVTTIGELLAKSGFRQGRIKNGEFIPASRQEIIESKMMRGETIPYIKEVNLPFLNFFEVDLNFSLDYKNGSEKALANMLSNICIKHKNEVAIPTLEDTDFFIHLCAHLYKEATTLPWIELHRDMTLYKYCDIYMLLSDMTDAQMRQVFERATELGLEKICAYAILETMGLFDMNNTFAYEISNAALGDDHNFRLKVVSPRNKKMLIYQTTDVTDRFFMESRADDLKEVLNDENA